VRHRPERGYTVQIGNAALLAELTGIAVVADFRSRDVAAGGQGAPLVPAFHVRAFSAPDEERAILNLGGIANVTVLRHDRPVLGFDTGPGNCLMDLWALRHLGQPCDADGAWAREGAVNAELLERMLTEAYFSAAPPKSTGRELFGPVWLERQLRPGLAPRDVQATLLELTAISAARAILEHAGGTRRVIACGGGTQNAALMRRLSQLLAPRPVESSDHHGIPAQWVEATAFAWLAQQAIEGRAGSLPSVTGARGPRTLGAIYPR
jgi:anhydro-N-acetylmuramic acid kinase